MCLRNACIIYDTHILGKLVTKKGKQTTFIILEIEHELITSRT